MMMPARQDGPRSIHLEHPRLLLVEGTDDYWFFRRIIERRRSAGIQIIEFGGKDTLGEFLTNVLVPRVRATDVVRIIGIVRDADDFYDRAFQSVGDSVRRAGLPVPRAPLTYADGALDGTAIRVAAYIMPDNASRGELETLCLEAVRGAEAMPCVEKFFECLGAIDNVPGKEDKARLGAFLSANRDDPNLRIGEALSAGVIPWNSPAFDGVHKFLDLLDAAN